MEEHDALCKRYMGNEMDGSSRGPLQQLEGLRIYRVFHDLWTLLQEVIF